MTRRPAARIGAWLVIVLGALCWALVLATLAWLIHGL